ncbi:MAG TPA: IPT/TIG domain-containing protein [Opitutaceae bacterium]
MTLTNLTPSSLPENPSGIYTFTLRVTPKSSAVISDSITPKIIVGAEPHDMKRSDVSTQLYEYDYRPAASPGDIAYYYLVTFNTTSKAETEPRQVYTGLEHVAIVTRDVLSIEVNRGPVGARIGVLGRGFTPNDRIGFDGSPVRTVYESPTSLGFFVPALPPGRTYQVTLSGDKGNSVVGTFKIDASDLSVDPASLTLAPGQKQSLTFTLTRPAPAGGTLLDVTTDIPESVIMPEVMVPEGQSSVTVTVEGGKPGTGSLFLKGYGSGEVTIPVTVTR